MGDKQGKVYAYVGTMGAGKSKKLCELYHSLVDKGKHVIAFKHVNDLERGGSKDSIVSRNGNSAPAVVISSLSELLNYDTEKLFDAVFIDEIQFFTDPNTTDVIDAMALVGVDVYLFGLDVTSDFKPFGLMGEILAKADEVKKIKCKCYMCGDPSRVSYYLGKEAKDGQVKVGDLDEYVPVCRECFYKNSKQAIDLTEHDQVEDKYYEVVLSTDGFGLEMGVYESDLRKAGYTIEEVKDIDSTIGVENLLKDLKYIE